MDEYENEERDGFKVEVKKPKQKPMPTSSGKKNRKAFQKFGHSDAVGGEDDIEEDIQTDREGDQRPDALIESSQGHKAGITVSQSLGIDPSVDSLALDEYDHIEVVEI